MQNLRGACGLSAAHPFLCVSCPLFLLAFGTLRFEAMLRTSVSRELFRLSQRPKLKAEAPYFCEAFTNYSEIVPT